MMQLALRLRREKLAAERKATALPVSPKIDSRIRRLFPFELTTDQQTAIRELSADLGRDDLLEGLDLNIVREIADKVLKIDDGVLNSRCPARDELELSDQAII